MVKKPPLDAYQPILLLQKASAHDELSINYVLPRSVGEYVAILVLLIKRDVPQFVTVFVVIIFSLGGALYLSLVGYYNDDNMDTENNNETR